MTSQTGQGIITIHILPNIPRSKSNHAMKFGQLILFFRNYAENGAGKLVPDLFLFFDKALHEFKVSGLHLSLDILYDLNLGIQ